MSQEKIFYVEKIESLLKFLGGLISIVAIISSMLSISGFLVLRSNANLLGITSLLHHSISDYLYEGGYFLLISIFSVIAVIIGNSYSYLITIILLIAWLLSKSKKISEYLSRINQKLRINILINRRSLYFISITMAVLLIIICSYNILPSPSAKDLLFSKSHEKEKQIEIAKRKNSETNKMLVSEYEQSCFFIFSSIFILLINKMIRADNKKKSTNTNLLNANHNRQNNKKLSYIRKSLLYFILVIIFFIFPIKFGQCIYPNSFHKLENLIMNYELLNRYQKSDSFTQRNNYKHHFLIKENPDSYILYNSESKELEIILKSQVNSISVKARENIFAYLE